LEILAGLLLELVTALLMLGLASLSVYWALRKGFEPLWVVVMGAAVVVAYVVSTFFLGQLGSHPDTVASIQQSFDQMWQLKAKTLADQKASAADIELVKNFCQKYILWSLPAWLLVAGLGAGFVAYYLVSSVLSKTDPRFAPPIPFSRWMVPEPLVFGLIAAGLIKVLVKENSRMDIVGDNFLIFFSALYTFAGLTIVSFYFQKWRFPSLVRLLGYMAILLVTYNLVCATLGVLDIWLDFRKIKKPSPEPTT
jgi:uncharacterized protein YybS (DUF2232 family)